MSGDARRNEASFDRLASAEGLHPYPPDALGTAGRRARARGRASDGYERRLLLEDFGPPTTRGPRRPPHITSAPVSASAAQQPSSRILLGWPPRPSPVVFWCGPCTGDLEVWGPAVLLNGLSLSLSISLS